MTKISHLAPKSLKLFVYFSLFLPALVFLLLPALCHELGPKPWKKLLINSGFCTLGFLTLSLLLTPFVKIFPQVAIFKKLNRFRRVIGETTFFYAVLHLTFYLMDRFIRKGGISLSAFFKPVIFTGSIAFLILCAMALTSNNWSVRTLTYKKWKGIHRTVYLAEFFVFLHLFYQSSPYAFYIFTPLVLMQGIRIWKKSQIPV